MKDIGVVINVVNENVTITETIDTIKKSGFKSVFLQWYNEDIEFTQQKQLEYARKQGLNIIFAHLGYQNINHLWEIDSRGDLLVERYKNDIKICRQNNIPMVVMHLTSKSKAPIYNEIGLRRIKEIVDYAKELGIKVAFENTKIKGYLEYVFENIDNDNIGLCYDSGHCHAHFDDEFNYEMFKNRIFAVHLHDNDKTDDQHLLPFDGTIDWKNVIKQLKYCNYDGPVTLELCYRNDYLNMTIEEFYKKGYHIGEKIAKMFE